MLFDLLLVITLAVVQVTVLGYCVHAESCSIYVAPYSRPVPYSRHSPYSRHFFNDTHENDCVWTLFPIAVSGDHSSTQVCKEILSILSIFFGEASQRYHAKLFSPDVSFSTQNIIIIIFEIPR